MAWNIEKSFKLGDLLTTIAILASLGVFFGSWRQDFEARRTMQADRIRAASAQMLKATDRWQEIRASQFSDLEPVFVTTSGMLKKNFDIGQSADYLWSQINVVWSSANNKILDSQVETAYIDLLPYFPDSRDMFRSCFTKLDALNTATLDSLLEATQDDVLAFEKMKKLYRVEDLANRLRSTDDQHRKVFLEQVSQVLLPVREALFDIMKMSDNEILANNREAELRSMTAAQASSVPSPANASP